MFRRRRTTRSGRLISHFAQHLVDRYGIDEVSQWYFEVWNEPNLDFWAGDPKQQTYYELYDATARALKAVSPRLRVGGPATAQAAWVASFIRHCVENHVPLDFVSTHVYGNDTAKNVLGIDESVPRTQMVCRAARKVHDQVAASPEPDLPIIWSEYNASYKNEPDVTDSTFMGPWLADTIRQCDGLADMMSYWTFSDVFEEQGVVKRPFYGGFGLIAEDELPKPAFNAFKLLHDWASSESRKLGFGAGDAASDGTLAIAVWNLFSARKGGRTEDRDNCGEGFIGQRRGAPFSRGFSTHGSLLHGAYDAMGQPVDPTQKQIEELRQAAEFRRPKVQSFRNGRLTFCFRPMAWR